MSTNGQSPAAKPRRSIARRILSWTLRGMAGMVVIVAVLILSGIIYESVMSGGDSARFAAPGQLIQVNGRTMHIQCTGEGSPTVILEAGFGGWSDVWTQVQPEASELTRICSYDRAGFGWSDPSNEPRTQEQIAIDLHALLTAANIEAPYILVGHSMAGKSIRLFATQYPEEVAGLIFVDARHESQEPQNRTPEQNAQDAAAYESSLNLYRIFRQTGLARLFGVPLSHSFDPALKALPDEVVYRLAMFGVREQTLQTMIAEGKGSVANDNDLRSAPLSDALPVMVLAADSSLNAMKAWAEGQQALAALSSNSKYVVVADTGHNIQTEQPQAVIDAIGEVLNSILTGSALQ